MWQPNVWHSYGCTKKGGYLGGSESGDTAPYRRDVKGLSGMTDSKGDKAVYVRSDSLYTALHGGEGVRITLEAFALSPDGPESVAGGPCRSSAMMSGKIASEDKNVVWAKGCYEIGSIFCIEWCVADAAFA